MCAVLTVLADKARHTLLLEAPDSMPNSQELKTFLSRIDSIHTRFLESIITGQRDEAFRQKTAENPSNSGRNESVHLVDTQGEMSDLGHN
jgi:hypothetical protein